MVDRTPKPSDKPEPQALLSLSRSNGQPDRPRRGKRIKQHEQNIVAKLSQDRKKSLPETLRDREKFLPRVAQELLEKAQSLQKREQNWRDRGEKPPSQLITEADKCERALAIMASQIQELHSGEQKTLDANKIVELSLAHPQIYNEKELGQLLSMAGNPFFEQLKQGDNLTGALSTDAKYMADRIIGNIDYCEYGKKIIQLYDKEVGDQHRVSFAEANKSIPEKYKEDFKPGHPLLDVRRWRDLKRTPLGRYKEDREKFARDLLEPNNWSDHPEGVLDFARCMLRNPEMATKILDNPKAREIAQHFQFIRIACSNPDLVRDILSSLAIPGIREALTEHK